MKSTPEQRRLGWVSMAVVVGLTLAACGSDDDANAGGGDGSEVAGEIQVSGSSTVLPISTAAGESFLESNPDAVVNVDGPGTGDGFELFCTGETDVSDASRPIADEEVAMCEDNGIEYVELKVAFDGMAVMTHPDNEAVESLSFPDLYALIGPEAEGFESWSDAQDLATELGSDTEMPDAELKLTGPGTESGTYDSFVEIALEGIAEERDQEATTRSDYSASPDDNVIISNIESSDTSLGWVGFAYASQAGDAVRMLPISAEPGGEAVEPSAETIADGSYPLSRSLYVYVNTARAEENTALPAFVDHYLENLAEFVEIGGYIALPDDQVAETKSAWEGR